MKRYLTTGGGGVLLALALTSTAHATSPPIHGSLGQIRYVITKTPTTPAAKARLHRLVLAMQRAEREFELAVRDPHQGQFWCQHPRDFSPTSTVVSGC